MEILQHQPCMIHWLTAYIPLDFASKYEKKEEEALKEKEYEQEKCLSS